MPITIGQRLLALLVVAATVGCSTSSTDVQSESPYVLDGCVRRDEGQLLDLGNVDGTSRTKGVMLGDARRAVILAPDRDANVCQWLTYGQALAAGGFRVALYDYDRETPQEQQLNAVVTAVRQAGAQSVVLVGAGVGGNAALISAASIKPAVNGVVALSPPRRLEGQASVLPAISRLRMPLLLISSDHDPSSAAPTVREYERVAATADVVMVTGGSSGTELLSGAEGDKVRAAVEAFLERHAPAS